MEGTGKRGRCQMIHHHLQRRRSSIVPRRHPVQINARHLAQAARPFSFRHTVEVPVRDRVKPINHSACVCYSNWPVFKKSDIINHCQSLYMDVTVSFSFEDASALHYLHWLDSTKSPQMHASSVLSWYASIESFIAPFLLLIPIWFSWEAFHWNRSSHSRQ